MGDTLTGNSGGGEKGRGRGGAMSTCFTYSMPEADQAANSPVHDKLLAVFLRCSVNASVGSSMRGEAWSIGTNTHLYR